MDEVITTPWTIAHALKLRLDDPTTTIPKIPFNFPLLDNRLFVWDTMPLRTYDLLPVSINGWTVIFTLTALKSPKRYVLDGGYDITANWEDRHNWARICYWYCNEKDRSYKYGGRVMAEGVSPTSREWSGSAILNNNQVELYYTAVVPDATICRVIGEISTSETGVELTGFNEVEKLLKADGKYYQTMQQNPYFNFRDPFPFIDPKTKNLYMLFEGNVACNEDGAVIQKKDIGTVLSAEYQNLNGRKTQKVGCIGIAVAKDLTGKEWELLPPLITAVGVNEQLERPHLVFKDDDYYLFFVTHRVTYEYYLKGVDGLYGFRSSKLLSGYEPLNGSGLVLNNPQDQPYQTYSHCVMPNGLVTAFLDNVPSKNTYRIGGTEAPTVKIDIKQNTTFIEHVLDYGYIEPMQDIKV